ncbi:hypothetical protein UPYG_G00049660, partial [Umbra pygmaea]
MQLNQRAETLQNNFDECWTTEKSGQVGTSVALEDTVKNKLKDELKRMYNLVYEGKSNDGENISLNQIHTDLHVTKGASGGVRFEHEVLQLESKPPAKEETIKHSDLFSQHHGQQKPIRTVMTVGIAGVGKTVCVHKVILDWAEGKENQDIDFIFPLPLCDISLREDDCSLIELLHQLFRCMEPIKTLKDVSKVLFIFDGLDESRLHLDFKHKDLLTSETKVAPLGKVITHLIKGDLLPSALIWIISR